MKNIFQFLKILQYLVVTIIIICVFAFFIYIIIPSPAKTVRNFFIALRNQNYQKAYSLIDGQYLINRGSLKEFTKDYLQAVETGTRTKEIKILTVSNWQKANQKLVEVQVTVLFNGKITETNGSYIIEKIPSKGWRIVENVSNLNKKATIINPGATTTPTNP